ncbi:XdhC family protein [Thalassotalea sp. PLHSN55]|uniref:XdhC family protein n=1 Tax=Thalassotalea sp. PLHSN55 TaxID=3435888 RepID=UPI003F825AEF
MSNQLQALIERWYPEREKYQWVVATVIETAGSAYRKTGAMLLINSMGKFDGLVSGGCLEADVMRQAQRVMDSGKARVIQYDMSAESASGWQVGLGCGGIIDILLQPLSSENHYQGFIQLSTLLAQQRQGVMIIDKQGVVDNTVHADIDQAQCHLQQRLRANQTLPDPLTKTLANSALTSLSKPENQTLIPSLTCQPKQVVADRFLVLSLNAPPEIAVFGGGLDAKPLVDIASVLGWKIHLVDHRMGYARKEHFQNATAIYRQPLDELATADFLNRLDASIIMGHNITFDANALAFLHRSQCQYIGLLGPEHRKDKVLTKAGVQPVQTTLAAPVGLNLGGELPEAIALAIIAEIQAYLSGSDALSLSNVLNVNVPSSASSYAQGGAA